MDCCARGGPTKLYSTPEDISERTFTDQNGKSVTAQVIKCTFESSPNKDKKLSRGAAFHLIRNAATLKKLEEQVEPKEFDKVVSVFLDFAIKGGAPMGYLGNYDTPANRDGGVNAKRQVHLEVFSNDTRRMDSFLNNAGNIKTGKGYLRLKRGAVLHIARTPDEISPLQPSSNTPSVSTPGYVPPTSPAPTPSSTTASSVQVKIKNLQVVALSEAPISKDKQKQEWYAVTIYEDKPCKVGWISKKDSNIDIVTQHDWKKLGFTVIEEKGGKGEGALQDSFVDANKVEAQADENLPNAGATSFFQELYKEIDTDGQDGVTPDEIQKALKDPELSERINKIIAYHPTEWKDDSKSEKWKRLATEFLKGEENKPLLQHEQKRIDDLIFWGKVPELSNANKVYHFNSIKFVENISSGVELQSVMPKKPENIRKIVLHSTATQEGFHQTVDDIFAGQKRRSYTRIAYHYVIYLDGSLHFGRPENIEGAHATNTNERDRHKFNSDSIGVVYVGGTLDRAGSIPKDTRTPEQKATQAAIIEALMERYPKATVHGHGELARMHKGGTHCPSFDVQADYGHYNKGKVADTSSHRTGALDAFN